MMTKGILDEYTWENCKLNRGNFGRFISQYLRESDKLVVNLDAPWGAGKTEFLKRLQTDLASHKHPVVYINSWESDFSQNPLSVVTSELLIQLSKCFESLAPSFESRLTKLFGKTLKCASIAGQALKLIGDNETAETISQANTIANRINSEITTSKDLSENNEELMKRVKDTHHQQINAMHEVKKQLSSLVAMNEIIVAKKLPVIVLVDELDRCRPNYAVEFLEVIKHFFETDHFVFLCASDTKQLSESIKTIYGSEFDSAHYLRRFFHRTITLPKPDFHLYLSKIQLPSPEQYASLIITPCLQNIGSLDIMFSHIISNAYENEALKIELRDVDQIIAKYNACLLSASHIADCVCINAVVLFYTILEQHIGKKTYAINTSDVSLKFEHLAGGKPLSNFIQVQISTCHEVPSTNRIWSDGSFVTRIQGESKTVLNAHTIVPTDYNRSTYSALKNSMCKTLSYYENSDVKYLLRDDIINLVELASYIE